VRQLIAVRSGQVLGTTGFLLTADLRLAIGASLCGRNPGPQPTENGQVAQAAGGLPARCHFFCSGERILMGRKPVLGVAGALLAGLALAGCQSSSTKTTAPAWQPTAGAVNNSNATTSVGGAQPTGIMAGGPQIPGAPMPVGTSSTMPGGGFPPANTLANSNANVPNGNYGSGSPASGVPLNVGNNPSLNSSFNPPTLNSVPASGGAVNGAPSASLGNSPTMYSPNPPSSYNTVVPIPAPPGSSGMSTFPH